MESVQMKLKSMYLKQNIFINNGYVSIVQVLLLNLIFFDLNGANGMTIDAVTQLHM